MTGESDRLPGHPPVAEPKTALKPRSWTLSAVPLFYATQKELAIGG